MLLLNKIGNVGIGFNVPLNKLDVNGVTRTFGLRVDGTANNGTLLKHIQANTSNKSTDHNNISSLNFTHKSTSNR